MARKGFSAAQMAALPYVEKYRRVVMSSSSALPTEVRFTLVALARYANPNTGRGAHPSRQTLAENTGVTSVTTIQSHLRKGLEVGFIVQERAGRPVTYRLKIPPAVLKHYQEDHPEEFDTSQARSDQPTGLYETPVISDQPTGLYDAPETTTETPLRPIEAVENPVSDQPTGREENIKDNPFSSEASESESSRPSVEKFMDEIARQRSESRAAQGAVANVFAYQQKVRTNLEDERAAVVAFMARRPGAAAPEYERERSTGLVDDGFGNLVRSQSGPANHVMTPAKYAHSHFAACCRTGEFAEAVAEEREHPEFREEYARFREAHPEYEDHLLAAGGVRRLKPNQWIDASGRLVEQ